jgi:chromosome segregation ATPase
MSDERESLMLAGTRLQTARALVQERARDAERAAEQRASLLAASASATAISAADEALRRSQARLERATTALRDQEGDVWAAHLRVAKARRKLAERIASVHQLQERLAKARKLQATTGAETPDLSIASDGRLVSITASLPMFRQAVADAVGCPLADLDAVLAKVDRDLGQLPQ